MDPDDALWNWVSTIDLTPPCLQNNTADADRLLGALKIRLKTTHIGIDLDLMRMLPAVLRKSAFGVRTVLWRDERGWILIGVQAADDPTPVAGLAVDLGTSRVVLRLVDLAGGGRLAQTAFDNPQRVLGADILTRIHSCRRPGGSAEMQALIVAGLNRATESICRQCGLSPQHIHAVSLAGNTAMTHFLLRLDPHWLVREPYIPVINRPGHVEACRLGWKLHPRARVFVFPNAGSYFGGDLIAGILHARLHRSAETAILVDVGTNAEVVVGNRHWLVACAGAAGPALEGGVTTMGMTAAPGVVDRVSIDADSGDIRIHTIGDRPVRGICGSGLIDLAAELYKAGMIDVRGRLVAHRCQAQLKQSDGLDHLVIVPAAKTVGGRDLTVSQADLDSLMRSKAAMYTILETITASVGLPLKEVSRFYVAGTFGSFIDPESAITIGMLPDLPRHRFSTLGNSSLEGAARVLAATDTLAEIDGIRDNTTYMELNVNQDFMNRFSAAKFYPHTDATRFPSVPQPPK